MVEKSPHTTLTVHFGVAVRVSGWLFRQAVQLFLQHNLA